MAHPVMDSGELQVEIRETELLRIDLQVESENAQISGFLKVGDQLRPLPIGSSLKDGTFAWLPGPGFVGKYSLLFIDRINSIRKDITVRIKPKFGLK